MSVKTYPVLSSAEHLSIIMLKEQQISSAFANTSPQQQSLYTIWGAYSLLAIE